MAQRFEGKNLEEALDAAAQGLGVPRFQLTYHVVVEKRGFLGGMKHVVVEADINDVAPDAVETPPAQPAVRSSSSSSTQPGQGAKRERGERGRRGGRGRGGSNRPERGGRSRREESDLQPGDFAQFAEDVPEQAAESDAAIAVRQWCEQALALSKLDLQVRSEENETQIAIRLYGRDSRLMTDRHGELLDALQVLANKALVGQKVEKDIELDCQQFKGRRTEELEQKARRMAEQVRLDGREQLLPAMTPIERRIVHLVLHEDADVTTESRGEGFYKRVAIIRRSAQQEQSTTPS